MLVIQSHYKIVYGVYNLERPQNEKNSTILYFRHDINLELLIPHHYARTLECCNECMHLDKE